MLKALATAVIRAHSLLGSEEVDKSVQEAVMAYNEVDKSVQEAVMAYNSDVSGDSGVSPAQAAIGKQPRYEGDVLGNFAHRVVSHGILEERPGLARQVAMRETAKLAMVRLHFSKGIQRAEVARSRGPTFEQELTPGMIVYYFRHTKYNNKTSQSKRKLSLKRWHGPGLLVAMEGDLNGFISHRGQLTKVAREHIRPASTMEQIASEVWGDAVKEVVEAAIHDMTLRGMDDKIADGARTPGGRPQAEAPSTPASAPIQPAVLEPAVVAQPLTPQEIANALQPASQSQADLSRRTSLLSMPVQRGTPAPGTPIGDLVRGGSMSSRMAEAVGRLAEADPEDVGPEASRKRPPDVQVEELQANQPAFETRVRAGPVAPEAAAPYDALLTSVLN